MKYNFQTVHHCTSKQKILVSITRIYDMREKMAEQKRKGSVARKYQRLDVFKIPIYRMRRKFLSKDLENFWWTDKI